MGRAADDAAIIRSSSTGAAESTGSGQAGGLVGGLNDEASVHDSYASGSATGPTHTGGLVGIAHGGTTIERSYAVGAVSSDGGGLLGTAFNVGHTIVDSYWDTESTARDTSEGDGAEGLTTDQMTGSDAVEHMDGFDFGGTWMVTDGYPALSWETP